jgi:N-methylhydantoinase B
VESEGSPRALSGLVDGEPVLAGQIVRVCTTGGGGWGDPLEREPDRVRRDVLDAKVSHEAARADYGVVLQGSGDAIDLDLAATGRLREQLRRERRDRPEMIDRGPGYETMRLRGSSDEVEPSVAPSP